MKIKEENHLAHYGTPRHSGRYPWGSGGNNQTARSRSFLDQVEELKRNGLSEAEAAKGLGLNTAQLRAAKSIAIAQQKQDKIRQAQRLQAKGMSNVAIGERMGLNESSVRSLLADGAKEKADILHNTKKVLTSEVDKKKYIDVGSGVEIGMGISSTKLAAAVAAAQYEGYTVHHISTPQVTQNGKLTKQKVLAGPGVTQKEVWQNRDQIRQVNEKSDDGGRTFTGVRPPTSISSKRIAVRYAEDGGAQADGVIYLRPGAKGLDLGQSRYAQVRIAVDGTHYLKGMAMYKDDLPDGVDVQFNTNKSNTGNKTDAMKKLDKTDPANPFGAEIKAGGQRGHLNIVNEEGDWDNWSRNFSSQFLSKQSPELAKQQLGITQDRKSKELDDIMKLTNPQVRKRLLDSYADDTDSAAVHLKAAIISRSGNHVILPFNSIKDNEIYAPNFKDGEKVALVRHPHGGTFEIPVLTVNNKNPQARKALGSAARDAVGINHKVAERLSGADFDGDTVLVIPNNSGKIKSTPALAGLKNFDPQVYKIPPGSDIPPMKKEAKQQEMGKITNLIADMTLRGANNQELAQAVRHSMVVIDAEKHNLDYRASARDNGIAALKVKYQGKTVGEKGTSNSGASTLITRAGSEQRVGERKLRPASKGGPVDKATGKVQYEYSNATYVNKEGKTVHKTIKSKKLAEVDDAHKLSSGTQIESVYADHSNKLKALANRARLESVNTKLTPYSPSARGVYKNEVETLNAKLRLAVQNRPLERQAQVIANSIVATKRQANPHMDSDDLKKIKRQALNEARIRTGAKRQDITITDKEWEAIQAGAISNHKLEQILLKADLDQVRQLATPRETTVMTSARLAQAKAMAANGLTPAAIAERLGISVSTLKSALDRE